MHLIDTDANLTQDSFDRDAVLARAHQAGVVQMVITGASRQHSPLARQHPGFLYATRWRAPAPRGGIHRRMGADMRALHAQAEVVRRMMQAWADYLDKLRIGANRLQLLAVA